MHETVKQSYLCVEELRLTLLDLIMTEQQEGRLPEHLDCLPRAEAHVEGGVVRLVLGDYLPVISDVRSPKMRLHWTTLVAQAVGTLSTVPRFTRAFCVIVPYRPRPRWDPDNVVYKYILDGVRYTLLCGDDTHQNMLFAVIGAVDRENPRTEVYIAEAPADVCQNLTKRIHAFLGQ
ncbi:MAG TPA: hypothetical protein EYP63_00565 [Desulfotomaculum sp.]|nr:hypothetical protein [Desulfotomaculum sp.]